jgi:hypothetical protein
VEEAEVVKEDEDEEEEEDEDEDDEDDEEFEGGNGIDDATIWTAACNGGE